MALTNHKKSISALILAFVVSFVSGCAAPEVQQAPIKPNNPTYSDSAPGPEPKVSVHRPHRPQVRYLSSKQIRKKLRKHPERVYEVAPGVVRARKWIFREQPGGKWIGTRDY